MSTVLNFNSKKPKNLLSEWFDPALLNGAILAYENRTDKLTLPNGETLNGLRFDRAHIEKILENTNVTHLYLRFIVSPRDNYITILAGGAQTTPMDNNGVCDKNKLYDYCEPCPSFCATFV